MGARNVATAFGRWSHISDRSFRVLAFMALQSMDGPRPMFWAGREALAVALGRMVPDEPARGDDSAAAVDARRARRAAFQVVKLCLAELVRAGVVAVDKSAAPGRNAVYVLHLDGPPESERGTSDVPDGVRQTYLTGYVRRTERGTSDVPPRRKTSIEEQTEEQLRDSRGTSPAGYPQAEPEPELISDYAAAAKILTERTGDLGASLLALVPADIVGMRERVIAAARLHPDHRPHPGPTDPCPGAPDAIHA